MLACSAVQFTVVRSVADFLCTYLNLPRELHVQNDHRMITERSQNDHSPVPGSWEMAITRSCEGVRAETRRLLRIGKVVSEVRCTVVR